MINTTLPNSPPGQANARQKLYPILLLLICLAGAARSQQGVHPEVALTATGNLIVRQVGDSLAFRELLTGQFLYKLPLPAGTTSGKLLFLAFNPSGTQLILSGSRSTNIYEVGRDASRKIKELPYPTLSAAFSHSGKEAYLLHSKNALKARLGVYDAQTWQKLDEKSLIAVSGGIMINANDSLIVYGSIGTIKTIDTKDLKLDKVLWERSAQQLIVFDPVKPVECASSTKTNNIQIRDLRNDSILTEIKRHEAAIEMLGYRPDGKQLFSLDKKRRLCVWSLDELALVAELQNVDGLPFWDSMGNLRIASCSDNPNGPGTPAFISLNTSTRGQGGFQPYKEPHAEKSISPSLGYAPETGFTLGLGLTGIVQPAPDSRYYRPSIYTMSVNYGFDHNQVLTMLSADSYIDDAWHLAANMEYDAHSRNFYFGIEKGSAKNKQAYFSNNLLFKGSLFRSLGPQVSIGFGYDLQHNTRAEFEQKTDSLPLGANGGALIGLGPVFRWDNRDNILSPSRGHLLDLAFLCFGPWQAGDYRYDELKVDYRKYFPLGAPANGRLIAVQGMADLTWAGQAPFYSLPYFTADKAFRGIYRNLYIDKQVMFVQAEFRSLFVAADPRYGYAIFAGASDGTGDFFKAYTPDIKAVYGLGLREQLFPKNSLLLRLDLAWTSKGDFGVFAGMGVPF